MNRVILGAAILVFACLIGSGQCNDSCSSMGAKKTKSNHLCECEYPYILGERGDDLQWICRLNGCEDWNEEQGKMVFYKPGAVMHLQGTRCRCVEGTDPYLMDASTLYHIRCDSKRK